MLTRQLRQQVLKHVPQHTAVMETMVNRLDTVHNPVPPGHIQQRLRQRRHPYRFQRRRESVHLLPRQLTEPPELH